MKRGFSSKHRRYLAILSGGHCQMCGKPLNGVFHADHIIPYSKHGKTSLSNGQALCPKCNLSKGNRIMSGIPTLREWQITAREQLILEWSDKVSDSDKIPDVKPLIAACPGAGKTWFAVTACQWAISDYDIELIILVCPSVNIKEQWLDTFKQVGIPAHARANNESLRYRVDQGLSVLEGNKAYCITYSQLSKDAELFELIGKKHRILTIADEVHHADDSEAYGRALERLASVSTLKLALSGTPFNSSGGALAMCQFNEKLDDTGRVIREAEPTYSYSYAEAINDGACRPVEFIKIIGRAESTYKSLTNQKTFKKVIDLARENKTDMLSPLLEPSGDFFQKMANEALTGLYRIKSHDSRAAMLVVVKDKNHGAEVTRVLSSIISKNPDWNGYNIQEIYNDTEKAHNRIRQLNHSNDRTDIVVTVRMISEGVDVKRFRVGLYATDYRTRMFFTQFVGRFVRWDNGLDSGQHAVIVIPAHPDLIIFAREIEQMVNDAAVQTKKGDESGEPKDKKTEYLGSETEATGDGLIYRSKEITERDLAVEFFKRYPELSHIGEAAAIKLMRDMQPNTGQSTTDHQPEYRADDDWNRKNDQLVSRIVHHRKLNGYNRYDTNALYGMVNAEANRKVGIRRKDRLTPVDKLKERHAVLMTMLHDVMNQDWDDLTDE